MARAMQLTHRWLAALVAGVLVWGVISAEAATIGPTYGRAAFALGDKPVLQNRVPCLRVRGAAAQVIENTGPSLQRQDRG